MVVCHRLGVEYGCLPSSVLNQGTVFDMMALDIGRTYTDWHSQDEYERGAMTVKDFAQGGQHHVKIYEQIMARKAGSHGRKD